MERNPYQSPDAVLADEPLVLTDPDELQPPTLTSRFAASFVDNMLLGVVFFVGAFGLSFLMELIEPGNETLGMLVGVGAQVAMVGLQAVYGALFEASGWHATPGKRLLGLVVVDERGEWLDLSRSAARSVVKNLSLSLCGLLAISVLLDTPRQRGVWDRVAGSRVVRRPLIGRE